MLTILRGWRATPVTHPNLQENPNMSLVSLPRIALALALVVLGGHQAAQAVPVGNVKSIRITNQNLVDGYFYAEEYTIPNAAGSDVASLSFGTTASGANFAAGFGSTMNGAINDAIGNCCGGTHSANNNSGNAGQQYVMTLPSLQTFNLNNVNSPSIMRVDDRQDNATLASRALNFKMEMLATGGAVVAERSFAMGDFALTGIGSTGVPRFGEVALNDFAVNLVQTAGTAKVIGASSAVNTPNVIGDGNVADTAANSMFITNIATVPQGFGYDLGGIGTVDTVRIYQHSLSGGAGGPRQRLETVNVHTSQGTFTFAGLADQDVIELNLGGISTAFVLIDPVSQHVGGTDPQLGIREVELLSSSSKIIQRENLAAGKTVTMQGTGWTPGTAAQLTDGITTWGPNLNDATTAIFNNTLSPSNGAFIIDLGEVSLIDGIGLMQQTGSPSGPRNMVETLILEFSNDNFATVLSSVTLTLEDGVIYQQLSFDDVLAQFVRFNPVSQYGNGSDLRIGFVEAQVFAALIPEPATASLGLIGLVGLLMRRRRIA